MSKYECAVREVLDTTQTIHEVAKKYNIHKTTLSKQVRKTINITTVEDVIQWCENPCVKDVRKILSPKDRSTKHIWDDIINQTLFLDTKAGLRERLYYIKNKTMTAPLCGCGAAVSWCNTSQRFNTFCSTTCCAVIHHSNKKRIETNLATRGVMYPYLCDNVKSKRDTTMMDRYGSISYNQGAIDSDVMGTLNNRDKLQSLYKKHQSTFGVARQLGVSQSYVSVCMGKLGIDTNSTGSAFETDIINFINPN